MLHGRRTFLSAVTIAALVPHLARAQSQPLRIVVPFAAGSGTDVSVRVVAGIITKSTGRPVIVDNKGGAGGVLGALDVARARPDGNTVLYTTGGFTTNAVLIKKLPFDPIADFTPITRQSRSSGFALLVSAESPYKSIDEFVAAAKANPGQLSFGSSGVGNTTHVIGVLFCKGVGIDLLHAPFKGTPLNELMNRTVDAAFLAPSVAAQQIRGGQLRALGISGAARSSLLPNVRTFAELDFKVQDIPAWSGVWGPAKMPPEVVKALYATFAKAAQTPEMIKYMRDNGAEPDTMPPEAFAAYATSEIERYRKLLSPLGIEMG
jgi:tripartite-type tricarboxylate transporter receptor subunit TctC